MNKCSICNSQHQTTIDAMLIQGVSAYKIVEELQNKHDGTYSKSSIYRHRKNCVLLPRKNSVYGMLYETGNRRLARAIERTQKIIKTYNYCRCSSDTRRDIRKRGLIWICGLCGGWIPYNLGLALKKRFKTTRPRQYRLVVTGRTY